jgi:uncharacterized membrane protein
MNPLANTLGSEDALVKGSSTSGCSSALAELTIGAVAGLRSAMPVAALAWTDWLAQRGHGVREGRGKLAHPLTLVISTVAALGELVADKTPLAPARIDALPLAGRAVSGAWSAAERARQSGRSVARGAALGAAGAVAASFGGYHLRRELTRRGASRLGVALAEDALAVGLVVLAVANRRRG